ncbi:hypothetical protein M8J76_015098 [Diaphorina citri]|nr:hypothetical protein M8J76_015098 [Diaphorina citri]
MLIQTVLFTFGVSVCLCTGDNLVNEVVTKVNALVSKGDLAYDSIKQVDAFKSYIVKWNRTYKDDNEIKTRFEYFKQDGKEKDEYYGTSGSSDRSPQEILQRTGLRLTGKEKERLEADRERVKKFLNERKKGPLPKSLDWRQSKVKVLNPVENQGRCRSCWAFATAAILESQVALFKNALYPLSKSQLVECDHGSTNAGCSGGNIDAAFEYVKQYGLESQADYPYRNKENITFRCTYEKEKARVFVQDTWVTSGVDHMMDLLQSGPIGVYLNHALIASYDGNPIRRNDSTCNPQKLDHHVVIVGYGEKNGILTWIVRNSWGDYGPDHGYFQIERGTNACGIESYAYLASVK